MGKYCKHLTAKPPFSLTVCRCQTPCRWVYPMQWYLNYQMRDKFITIHVTPEAVLRLPRWKPSTDHLTQNHSQLPGHWLPPPSPFPSRTCPATPRSSSAWQWVLAVWSPKTTSTLLVFSKSRHSPSALKTGPSWLHSVCKIPLCLALLYYLWYTGLFPAAVWLLPFWKPFRVVLEMHALVLTEVTWDEMEFANIKTARRQRRWLAYQQFGVRKCHLQFWVQ